MMVILGLGSNLGDQLEHLRQALHAFNVHEAITPVQVSPLYLSQAQLPEMAPPEWDRPFINLAVACHTRLKPQQVLDLVKYIEAKIGRQERPPWAPRIIDIDLLAWDQEVLETKDLTLPHVRLCERPFALWPLLDLWPDWQHPKQKLDAILERWGDRYSGQAPFQTKQINQRIDVPKMVGILNVTPNSFTDGDPDQTVERVLQKAQQLFEAGAEMIDMGAESTHPKSAPIEANTEWQRLQPVLERFQTWRHSIAFGPQLSLDTRHGQVVQRALDYDVNYINDVTAGEDHELVKRVAEAGIHYIFMHQLGVPPDPQVTLPPSESPVDVVYEWAQKHIDAFQAEGMDRNQLIFDPGVGFGKTWGQSYALLRQIDQFTSLGLPIYISHSRKGFLRHLTSVHPNERDIETCGLSLGLAAKSVSFLRVHNVAMHMRLFKSKAMIDSQMDSLLLL